jgi:hypothetical protein
MGAMRKSSSAISQLAALILTAFVMSVAGLVHEPAVANPRQGGTIGVVQATTTAGAVHIRRIGVFDDSRTGLGARLVEHIRKRLIKRGVRIDPGAPTLLILRPNIVNQRGGASATDDPLSVSPDGQARLSAAPVWRHSKDMGMSRAGKVPTNQLGGGRLSLHLRNKLHILREAHSVYRIQLQLERDGQAPLWHGAAVAVGRSINPERTMQQMIDRLLARLGRSMRYQQFSTR